MKRILLLILFLVSLVTSAQTWDEALYKQIEQSIKQPNIEIKSIVDIRSCGASTDANAKRNQKAIQKAIDKCARKGGGRVVIPSGMTFRTGAIEMKSNVELRIEEGATLEFVFQPELYPIVETSWEGLDCYNLSPCIYALNADNIAITGRGTIDGGGTRETWWPWCGATKYGWKEGMVSQKIEARPRLLRNGEDGVPMTDEKGKPSAQRTFTAKDGLRPQLIGLNQCHRILIEDVTLLRSPFWVIHPLKCTDVTVRRVHINNDGPNGDGCDPESCDRVLIEDCYFNTGDDCIAIKSGRNSDGRRRNMPSQNIIIRRCEMKNGHGGVVVGSEISGGLRNVFAHDCKMDSPNLDRVLRIKTNSCRGGIIENIFMRDIEVGQCREAVLRINLDYEHNEICCRGFYPTVRNVLMENVTCKKSKYGVQIIGLDEDTYVHGITVRNCRFDGVKSGNSITGKTRDIKFENLFINGSLALQTPPYKNYSQWMTYSEMKRTPKSYLLDFSKRPKWSYVMGIELESMLDTYLHYGDTAIWRYCQEYTDTMINEKGEIRGFKYSDYNLDNIRTGHFVARMYQQHPEQKNLTAMKTMMKQLKEQPRTDEDKVFWHKAIYSYQVWLDGIFMGLPYNVLTASMICPPEEALKIYDDAVDQVKTTYIRTFDPVTGLNRHAWDETHEMFWADKHTGQSRHCWGRAQGWFTMALVELLDALPKDYALRDDVIDILRQTLDGVIRWQDKQTGVWYQVMDSPERKGNYLESTCSAMFAYSLLKAYRMGYVSDKYRDAGIRAYRGIINNFIRVNEDKTISLTNCCSVAGLGPGISDKVLKAAPKVKENKRRDGSYEYYLSEPIRDNDAKGIGPFIWASLEMEELGYDIETTSKPIDRKAVVNRNNPKVSAVDPLAALTVGNGRFATTVDITGMQTFTEEYKEGVPLCTMSEWGWHSFPNTDSLLHEETMREFHFPHRTHKEVYAVEYKKGGREQKATQYFRINPHRLNLGCIGMKLKNADGTSVKPNDITDIKQQLRLYDGTIDSEFSIDGVKTEVMTAAMQDRDATIYRIKSPLLSNGQAVITIRLPYPTGKHADDASDWNATDKHASLIIDNTPNNAIIKHQLDGTTYYLRLRWDGNAEINKEAPHLFCITTENNVLTLEAEYSGTTNFADDTYVFDQHIRSVQKAWSSFWQSGGIADFSLCTDKRAPELERRIILSQYLTQVNCAGTYPPQETGLTYNSWFGRPHLEMTWWHVVHFSLWNRTKTLDTILKWYNNTAYQKAKEIAQRQGYPNSIRWMKMTDPWAGEAPSNTGSFLIWQQPHYIYMAEELYRANPTIQTLKKYAAQVEETAQFMADFTTFNTSTNRYCIKGATAMQESMSKDFSYNHPFELAYWQYGLKVAQDWRERQGLQRNKKWDEIINSISALPENDSIYTAGIPLEPFRENVQSSDFDPFKTPEQTGNKQISEEEFLLKSRSDHPAVLGACGMIPVNESAPLYSTDKMRKTLHWVMNNWKWSKTWGWDYGMVAMTAARLGETATAIDALLIKQEKNRYLVSGHNYQTADRLRIYLPGNGSLLSAIAMMCAGWDGCKEVNNPGFPKDGKWNVRWENLKRMQ